MASLIKSIREYLGEVPDEDKEKVYEELEKGADPSPDYFFMTALSTIMVVLGLLINNVAVIIGAMLVAPLMISIITMALGIVRGDFKLFIKAAEAEAKGALLVVIISVFITLFSPFTNITPEIHSRIMPDLFYLFIALAAGGAGAYALSRPKLSTMLPGVAIAVAILPPLATLGIGLGLKRFDVAFGALLLFLTNLIAINLASTVIFWILGLGPKRKGDKQEKLQGNLLKTLALLAIISIPLTWIMINTLDHMNTSKTIEDTINGKLLGMYQTKLISEDYYEKEGVLKVEATIKTGDHIDENYTKIIKNALEEKLNRKVDLTLEIIQLNVINYPEDPEEKKTENMGANNNSGA